MPGLRNIIVGAGIFALGLAIGAVSGLISNIADFSVVAVAAVFIGLVQAVFGIGQMAVDLLKPKRVKEEEQRDSEHFGFIHSMIAMVAADGKIEDSEIKRVMELFAKVMKISVPESDVRNVADQYQNGSRTWQEAIDFNARKMSPDRRLVLFKACVMVASADGEIADVERARIHELAHQVGISEEDEERVLNETLANIKASQARSEAVAS